VGTAKRHLSILGEKTKAEQSGLTPCHKSKRKRLSGRKGLQKCLRGTERSSLTGNPFLKKKKQDRRHKKRGGHKGPTLTSGPSPTCYSGNKEGAKTTHRTNFSTTKTKARSRGDRNRLKLLVGAELRRWVIMQGRIKKTPWVHNLAAKSGQTPVWEILNKRRT